MKSHFAGLKTFFLLNVVLSTQNFGFNDNTLGIETTINGNNSFDHSNLAIWPQLSTQNEPKEESSVSSIVGTLEAKLIELGLDSLINEEYLGKLVEEGNEKEFQERLGITRQIFHGTDANNVCMAYKPAKRDYRSPASRRKSGEDFLHFHRFPNEYVQLHIISGNSNWLPAYRDSSALCTAMNRTSVRIYLEIRNKTGITAENILRDSWDNLLKGQKIPGCLSALYAVISPQKRISVSNLGRGWAGLYRNGVLIQKTHRTMHRDGFPYQLCLPDEVYEPLHQDILYQSSRTYDWRSRVGDILVMVSGGVREVLDPKQIYSAFTTVQKMESGESFSAQNTDFSLVAMGIAKAAEIASGETQPEDISVLAAVVK